MVKNSAPTVRTPLKYVGFGMPGGGSAVLACAPFGAACPAGVALSIREVVQNERAAVCAALLTVWVTAVAGELAAAVLLAKAVPPVRAAVSVPAMTAALAIPRLRRDSIRICTLHYA